jgi:release factor glutamine methyltransferase
LSVHLSTNKRKVPTTIIEIPTRNVVSIVHYMRQELSIYFPISEIEALINYTFKEVLGYSKIDLIMRAEQFVADHKIVEFAEVIAGLKQHVPIQYIFGRTRFYGVEFLLTDDVLIPRPETEELVNWIVNDYKNKPAVRILDIGTGSGCIPVALKVNLSNSTVDAIDISSEALLVAGQNAIRNKVDVSFYEFDILNGDSFGLAKYDLIVSNPPYVTQAQSANMLPNVLNYEPHLALFVPDHDPLMFYRAIAQFCKTHLNPGGALYLEINEDYASDTADLLQAFNFTDIKIRKDLNGKFRMVKAIR